MAQVSDFGRAGAGMHPPAFLTARPAQQAYWVLYAGFAALPAVAGLDKFFHLLVDWDIYLAPQVGRILPMTNQAFLQMVGVIEIAAGFLVVVRPMIGGYVVMLWLLGITLNLLIGGYYDIALRDFGLALGALALARLAQEFEQGRAR